MYHFHRGFIIIYVPCCKVSLSGKLCKCYCAMSSRLFAIMCCFPFWGDKSLQILFFMSNPLWINLAKTVNQLSRRAFCPQKHVKFYNVQISIFHWSNQTSSSFLSNKIWPINFVTLAGCRSVDFEPDKELDVHKKRLTLLTFSQIVNELDLSKLCEFCIKSCAERRKMTAVNWMN